MRHTALTFLLASTLACSLTLSRDADACGGCFVQQSENTQVTGHRMILSVSKDQSTLWDQIQYSGAPESFAWVLPVKGLATIGLSSDALLETLEQLTQVSVVSPSVTCPNSCGSTGASTSYASTATSGGGGVTVVSQAVVGPYETVQLSASDPAALTDWLSSHGYDISADLQPVVAAYINDGFDFLALKLVPGEGVSAMRPVRITTPGAGTALPLRMVAAGTGAVTPLTLWVFGEGRYAPSNFDSFEIQEKDLVWDWGSSSSNYKDLRAAGFAASNGAAWLVEAGEPTSQYDIESILTSTVYYDPVLSGYGEEDGTGAAEELAADLATLFSGIAANATWVTRLSAELPKAALTKDLQLGAAAQQSPVDRYLQVPADQTQGAVPCPPDPCGGQSISSSGSGPGGFTSGAGGAAGSGGGSTTINAGGCALGPSGAPVGLGGLLVAAAALAASRRRKRG
jgi:hypothetical protein